MAARGVCRVSNRTDCSALREVPEVKLGTVVRLAARPRGPPPSEALTSAKLARKVGPIIERRGLRQASAAELLGIEQPRVSALTRGRLAGFPLDRRRRKGPSDGRLNPRRRENRQDPHKPSRRVRRLVSRADVSTRPSPASAARTSTRPSRPWARSDCHSTRKPSTEANERSECFRRRRTGSSPQTTVTPPSRSCARGVAVVRHLAPPDGSTGGEPFPAWPDLLRTPAPTCPSGRRAR